MTFTTVARTSVSRVQVGNSGYDSSGQPPVACSTHYDTRRIHTMANVLVVYYSAYGHTFRMAQEVAEGARAVSGTEVRLRRVAEFAAAREAMSAQPAYVAAQEAQSEVPEAALDDLRWADGICWGSPTRFGNMAAQMKQLIDSAGALWMEGALEDKPAGVFTSSNTIHGGQESTILATHIPLLHLGMIVVGTPYGQNPQILVVDAVGGSPYGPSTLAGVDGSLQPADSDLLTARNLGKRVARAADLLKPMRQ